MLYSPFRPVENIHRGGRICRAPPVCLSLAAFTLFAANRTMLLLGAEPAPVAPADPIEWTKPEQAPTFREVLKDADYKSQFDKAAAQIDIRSLKKSKSPLVGQRILRVEPAARRCN